MRLESDPILCFEQVTTISILPELRLEMAATRLPGSHQIARSLTELARSAAGGADENVASIGVIFRLAGCTGIARDRACGYGDILKRDTRRGREKSEIQSLGVNLRELRGGFSEALSLETDDVVFERHFCFVPNSGLVQVRGFPGPAVPQDVVGEEGVGEAFAGEFGAGVADVELQVLLEGISGIAE